ncbi:MAG TPA: hypothetical protein VFK54_11380 [Candidatus Limnocylindrales bacterium]|nr:hypothetical protein [Candidatus Limnocylindrales bacterium]
MSFVRRLFGGRPGEASEASPGGARGEPRLSAHPAPSEEERERALLREEADRLDELQQRQVRYAAYAWRPSAQGGERRADDEDREPDA